MAQNSEEYAVESARDKDGSVPEQEPPTSAPRPNDVASNYETLPLDYRASNDAEYRLIKAGSFTMGSDRWLHKVTLTQNFYLGKHPITRGEFKRFVEATGYKTTAEKEGSAGVLVEDGSWEEVKGGSWKATGFEQTDSHPVVCVSYEDALAYVDWLNESSKSEEELNGFKPTYRLPTEAEWEYACRAGTQTKFFWGDDEKDGKGYLNAAGAEKNPDEETGDKYFSFDDGYSATSPVGSFDPNPWGLYDMLGNVCEWTSDWLDIYPPCDATDPKGAGSGSHCVLRGGCWFDSPAGCRCDVRGLHIPGARHATLGFRVAFSLTK